LESILYADGVLPEQLFAMTPKDVHLRLYGILKKRIDAMRLNRDTNYTIYCSVQPDDKRVDIWEFHPLPGDPSKKDRLKAKLKVDKSEARRLKKQTDNAMEVFRRKGLIS
jgi:hypothetical protein